MKLYAKMTSERGKEVTKGGNDKIIINIKIDNNKRFEIGNLVLTCSSFPSNTNLPKDFFELTYYPINTNCQDQKINSGKVVLYQTKNKKIDASAYMEDMQSKFYPKAVKNLTRFTKNGHKEY